MTENRLLDISNRMASLRDQETAIDPAAFQDTMEGLDFELERKVEACVYILEQYEKEAIRMEGIALEYEERIAKVRRNADYLRGYLQGELQNAGVTKVETPELLVNIVATAKVLILSKEDIPTQLMRHYTPVTTTQEPAPDKKVILQQLKDGEVVPGCSLDHSYRMTIKRREGKPDG
jgi:hypothetical protein